MLHIQLIADQDLLLKTKLLPSKSFEWSWEGSASKSLEKLVTDWLEAYRDKRELPSLNLSLSALSPFQQKVLRFLETMRVGEVIAYGELAEKISHPGAARAVGTACCANPFPLLIPCHRVIAAKGKIGGFGFGLKIKQALLDFEFNHYRP